MRIRNTTGIPQIAPRGSQLHPGIWMDVPGEVSLWDAIWMHTNRYAELAGLESLSGSGQLIWKEEDGTHLYWLSPFSLGDGYATAAENTVHALIGQGCKLEVHQCWFMSVDGLRQDTVQMLQQPIRHLHEVGLCMATPGEFKKLPTPYRIGLTMYEADDPLKNLPEWRHDCAEVDRLFVPCEYCKGVFEEFVTAPVQVTPLAINPAYFYPVQRQPKDLFTFITFGTLSGRKAPLETLEAFKKAFPEDKYPDVRIVFKTRLGYFGWGERQLPDLNSDPRVKIVSEDWYVPQMLQWMLSADCMVFPSKGEGFGMPPREAMATGLPVILSDNTGLSDVCNKRYNWPIPTAYEEESPLGGNWRIPDWDYLVDAMRDVYHNREKAYRKGYLAAQWFARTWSNEQVAQHMLDCINEVVPADSHKRHNRVSVSSTEDFSIHEDFLDWIGERVRPPSVLWDTSPGDGALYAALVQRGYTVVALATPDTAAQIGEDIRQRGMEPDILVFPDTRVSRTVRGRQGLQLPAAFVSLAEMQKYGDNDIALRLKGMLELTDKVFFSVPSVYYPDFYAQSARLMRQANWMDILRNFAAVIKPYGDGDKFFKVEVRRPVSASMAVRKPRLGRVLQGVWHPN